MFAAPNKQASKQASKHGIMGHSMRIQFFRYCYGAYSYQIVGNVYKSLLTNSPQEFQIEALTTMYAENIRFLLFPTVGHSICTFTIW